MFIATGFTGVNLLLSLGLFAMFDRGSDELQFVTQKTWIDADYAGFNVQYAVGVDGLSVTMVLLTGMLFVVATLVSWQIALRPKEYFAWLLALETAVMGVFLAQDLLLFFLFWELELIPMFFLISIWGTGRKEYSAMKFVLYTLSGSALMLVGFLVLGFSAGTFDMQLLAESHVTNAALSASSCISKVPAEKPRMEAPTSMSAGSVEHKLGVALYSLQPDESARLPEQNSRQVLRHEDTHHCGL